MTDIAELTSEEVEAEARKQGWKPEDEWKGDPPKRGFVSAEEFLKAGDDSLPLVTKERDELKDRLDDMEGRFDKLQQQSSRYKEYMDKALAGERRRSQQAREDAHKAIEQLQAKRAEAITEGDGEAVVRTEREIEDLKSTMPPPPPDPEIDDWMEANGWYRDDKELATVADGVSLRLREEKPHLEGRAHLDAMTERVKELMPQKFKNPKRDDPPPLGSAKRGQQGNGHTFADLPKEAQDAYYEFKEMIEGQGKKYTKDQYLKNYEWEDE